MSKHTTRVAAAVTKEDVLYLLGAKGMELTRLAMADKIEPEKIFILTNEIEKWATMFRAVLATEPEVLPPAVKLEALNKYRGLGSGDEEPAELSLYQPLTPHLERGWKP